MAGGSTNVTNVDNSGLEKQNGEMLSKMDQFIELMGDAPKKTAKFTTRGFNEAKNR